LLRSAGPATPSRAASAVAPQPAAKPAPVPSGRERPGAPARAVSREAVADHAEREFPVPSPAPAIPSPPAAAAPTVLPEANALPVASPTAEPEPPSAEDLLATANRWRARRLWADAERAYVRAMHASPGSDASYTAGVAAGSLRLERLGRPADAAGLFAAALRDRPRGALAEEAAFGLAECYRAMGDALREAEALRRFLAGWPGAAMADAARARLAELAAGGTP